MNASFWSTSQLAEFLEIFEHSEEQNLGRLVLDRVADALDAEVVALLTDGEVTHSMGFPAHAVPTEFLREVSESRRSECELPGIGAAHALCCAVEDTTVLLVVRAGIPFDREEQALFRSMTKAFGLALHATQRQAESRALMGQLEEKQQLNERMAQIQQSISHRAPLQEVLDSITRGATEILRVEVAGLRITGLDTGSAAVASLTGYPESFLDTFRKLGLGDGFAGRAYTEGQLVYTDDFPSERVRLGKPSSSRAESAMATPIFYNNDIVGVLNVATHERGRCFTEAEQDAMRRLADHASLAVTDAMAVHSLQMSLELAKFQADHDGLTSLPNRNAVLYAIDQQTRHCGDSAFCVMYIDLDRFKRMNDAHGHSFGDAVLIEVSRRLLLAVRTEDLVARISGDEFVVLVPDLTGEEAKVLALRVREQVSGLLSIAGHQVEVQLSIGVAQHAAGLNAEDVLTNADVAMYQSKAAGHGNVTCYIPQMRTDMTDRRVLEQEIATGLLRGEFLAYFQPSLNVETGTIRSLEALVRWQHPTRGLLAPQDFVSLAEETGQIIALDHLVLGQACRRLKEWTAVSKHLTVSVNLSAAHFTDPGLVQHISSTLKEHRLHPSRLWLEITESMVMENDHATLDILTAIRQLGVRFMMDDFGTGYSSLVYLKRYPIDALKIDREFVAGLGVDIEDEAIVTSIIRLAEVLGHEVVAEGVETIEQQDWLSTFGCNHTQGFLFSKPVHGDEVPALLAVRQRPRGAPTT